MARPIKYRKVDCFPKARLFSPKPICSGEVIILKVEELEAMRLKDIEGLTQEECADNMQVSRQTFQNIIESARLKVTTALLEGKAINISGGHYTTDNCKFKCLHCGAGYSIKYEQDISHCPMCGSERVVCSEKSNICKTWCNAEK